MQEQRPSLATSQATSAGDERVEDNGSASSAQEGGTEKIPSLPEMLKRAELQAQEHYDAWLRAKAECDNIRKRAQADIANAHKYALESFAAELLPVRDSLEAALTADKATVEALRQGVELTLKQLDSALDRFAIKEVNPIGDRFDPHKHQAMTTVESDKAPNTVVHVLQKGYLLNDRVLRPALVTVAKGKDKERSTPREPSA
jgi:molecular chaperone GrpE